jgi:hypothetical protein
MNVRRTLSKASLRGLRQRQRKAKMQAELPVGVRVLPASDDIRRVLKHPARGGFPEQGGTEWPDDRFTKRRLADGSVTREETEQPQPRSRTTPEARHQ